MENPSFTCQGIPSIARVTLTAQEGRRMMLPIKTTYPELRVKFGIIEEHNYLPAGATVALQGSFREVYTAPDRRPLAFEAADGQAVITLPEICGCLMVVAEEG